MENSSRQHIRVEPFLHQVGGHSSLLCLDEDTICKPLVPRELEFYQSVPASIQPFTPHFYGVLEICARQEDDGYISFLASPPKNYQPKIPKNGNSKSKKVCLRKSGSIEVLGDTELFTGEETEATVKDTKATAMNPWVLTCHRTNLQKIMFGNQGQPNFILIENLATHFTHPCILDLKMGTQQYGDAASLAKKQSKMYKVVSTTSGKLGVRIGGMQVYQVPDRCYICRNKFYGRSLSVAGFQQALRQFLHNGTRLRLDVLPPLIRRLEELVVLLSREDSIRFYTTSLLLLYEGDDPLVADARDVSSLLLLEDCTMKRCASAEILSPLPDAASFDFLPLDDNKPARRRRSSTCLDDSTVGSQCLTDISTEEQPTVDVRIIDFAHTTFKGVDDPVQYSGPDRGFLFGLESIIAYLKAIERDHG